MVGLRAGIVDTSVHRSFVRVAESTNVADIVVQLRRIEFTLSEDTVETKRTRVYRYGTGEGVRDFGNIRISFDTVRDTVNVQHALVIDSMGGIHVVEPETVQILPDDSFNVFSDSRVALIPLTGLDIGATAIIIDTTTSNRGKDIGPWGVSIYEQLGVLQERLEIKINWTSPGLRPTWHSELDGMSCTETDNGSLSCFATGIPPYPADENAHYDDAVPQFVVAEKRSWANIGEWYRPLFQSALTSDQSVVDMAAQLSDGLDDETEVLRAIHRFVATKVRYVGLEHGDSAYVPHPTSTTLERRYGDCKDKAALLIDLLHHAGIEMSPVLVSTTRRNAEKLFVPTRNYFDHLIVCGTLTNGKEYCLDGTDPYTGIESLSDWIQGAVALHVQQDAGPILLSEDRYRWILREDLELTLTETGGLIEKGEMEYAGTYGTSIRQRLSGMNGSELQDWAMDDYHGTVSSLVDPSFEFSGIDDIETGVTVSWDATYTGLLSPSEDLEYAEQSSWLNQAINALRTENKVFDYRFPGLRYESMVTVNVNDGWEVGYTGPDIVMQNEFGDFRRNYEIQGQTVVINTSFAAASAVINVDDIERFTRFMEIIREEGVFRLYGTLRDAK